MAWLPSCAGRRRRRNWTGGLTRCRTRGGGPAASSCLSFPELLFSFLPTLPCHHVPETAGPTWWPPGPHPWCPPQVFVELNELMLDRSQEPHWRETARWIKFEEDVEEETERWGKPRVASLSFRSLLELRRTIAHGRDPAGLALGLRALFTDRRACAGLPGSWGPLPGVRRGLAATLGLWNPTACEL